MRRTNFLSYVKLTQGLPFRAPSPHAFRRGVEPATKTQTVHLMATARRTTFQRTTSTTA